LKREIEVSKDRALFDKHEGKDVWSMRCYYVVERGRPDPAVVLGLGYVRALTEPERVGVLQIEDAKTLRTHKENIELISPMHHHCLSIILDSALYSWHRRTPLLPDCVNLALR
jgi:hypothetical protein